MHTQEINGNLCIICPKHKYKISLAEGEGWYRGRNPMEKPPVFRWYSKGVKQRTHTVTEKNGEVFVKLCLQPAWIDSDYYQGEKGKIERAKAEAADDDTLVMDEDDVWRLRQDCFCLNNAPSFLMHYVFNNWTDVNKLSTLTDNGVETHSCTVKKKIMQK